MINEGRDRDSGEGGNQRGVWVGLVGEMVVVLDVAESEIERRC